MTSRSSNLLDHMSIVVLNLSTNNQQPWSEVSGSWIVCQTKPGLSRQPRLSWT